MSDNPLKKYSVRPGTFVNLPSKGKFYPDQPELSADGELEVKPMSALDEIRLKNPDGLLNNESLYQVIEHVVPGIKKPKDIPTPDLDVIILSMRIATYGDTMPINATCSKCKTADDYVINLPHILANAKEIDLSNKTIEIDGLTIELRPHTTETSGELGNYQMEVLRAAKQLELNVVSDQHETLNAQFRELVKKGSTLLFDIASKHIVSITTPDDIVVTDADFITEWLTELRAPEYQILSNAVTKLSVECIDRMFKYTCQNEKCKHINTVEVSFDPSNFFGSSSL